MEETGYIKAQLLLLGWANQLSGQRRAVAKKKGRFSSFSLSSLLFFFSIPFPSSLHPFLFILLSLANSIVNAQMQAVSRCLLLLTIYFSCFPFPSQLYLLGLSSSSPNPFATSDFDFILCLTTPLESRHFTPFFSLCFSLFPFVFASLLIRFRLTLISFSVWRPC